MSYLPNNFKDLCNRATAFNRLAITRDQLHKMDRKELLNQYGLILSEENEDEWSEHSSWVAIIYAMNPMGVAEYHYYHPKHITMHITNPDLYLVQPWSWDMLEEMNNSNRAERIAYIEQQIRRIGGSIDTEVELELAA